MRGSEEFMSAMRMMERVRVGRAESLRVMAAMGMCALLVGLCATREVQAQTPKNETRGAFEVTSLVGRKLYAQPDDDAVIAAKKKLAADPKNAGLALALSQAEAGRRQYREAVATCTKGLAFAPKNADLYIERGHRELGLREFRSAERDLAHAGALDPTKLDAFYHLGLAHYFQGQFSEAAGSFQKACALAKNDDSLIDCTNWLYVSLRRAGKKEQAVQALKKIGPDVKNKEAHLAFYLRLEHFYQGSLTEQAVLPAKPADPNDTEAELSFDTVTYGVGNWRLYNNRDAKGAAELFREVVSGNAWNAWGFVGAEVELARARTTHVAQK